MVSNERLLRGFAGIMLLGSVCFTVFGDSVGYFHKVSHPFELMV